MSMRNRIIAGGFLALAAGIGDAAAVCPIHPAHVVLWVGDTASHPLCNYDTIQQAVDAVQCPETEIVLTHEHTYTSQHVTINNKPSMTFAGVDTSIACGTEPPVEISDVRTIDGSGNGNHSVFSITNSDVTFKYLEITGGHTTINARGGGISAAGSSKITLQASTVDGNSADFGGGIAVVDAGTLTLQDHVAISNNIARANGGGVFLAGTAHMDMGNDQTIIVSNQATGHDGDFGYGGGVFATNDAVADITGLIGFNSARAGGGAAAVGANDNGMPAVRLFATDPARPVLVLDNAASVHGGGLYVNAKRSFPDVSFGEICAQDFRIDGNHAPDGAAIYVANDNDVAGDLSSGVILLNTSDTGPGFPCSAQSPASAGIGHPICVAGQSVPCNEVADNEALEADGSPSNGAVITGTSMVLNRMNMHDNAGAQMIRGYDTSYLDLTNSLIVDNHSAHEIVQLEHGIADDTFGQTISNVTIANNTIDDGFVFFVKHGFDFKDNLVWQPGHSTIDYQEDGCDACFHATNALVSEAASFPEGLAVFTLPSLDAFGFVDATNPIAAHRDYHVGAWLLNGHPLFPRPLDFAVPVSGDDRDLDNAPRDQDITGVDNGGVRDLGAYELQASAFIDDRIFADAFGDRVSLLR